MERLIIAIDPDTQQSGVTLIKKPTKTAQIYNLSFAEIVDLLYSLKSSNLPISVYVEAGWLNSSNWHLKNHDSKMVAAAKGKNVGANHETGKK